MDHATNRSNKPNVLLHLSLLVEGIVAHIIGCVTLRLIAKTNHLSSDGVEFWMSCEGQAGQLPIEVVQAECFECGGVHGVRRGVFLERKELAVPVYDVGVCG